jgi:hypothetical protein
VSQPRTISQPTPTPKRLLRRVPVRCLHCRVARANHRRMVTASDGRLPPLERVVLALAIAANLALVWTTRFIPAVDHVNHIASLHVLARLHARDPFFTQYFAVKLSPVPDLLAEALWWTTLRGLDAVTAGRVLLSLYIVALPLAFGAFLRRYAPRSVALVMLAPLVTFNMHYANGSTNFVLGIPVFLLACVALADVTTRPRALVAFVALAALTYLAHVYDLLCLLGFAGVEALRLLVAARRGERPFEAPGALSRTTIATVALAALFALALRFVLGGDQEWTRSAPTVFALAPQRAATFFYASVWPRGALRARWLAPALAAVFLAPVVTLARRGGLRAALRWTPLGAAALYFLLTFFSPANVGDEENIAQRFAVACFLMLFASVELPASRALSRGIFVTLTALFVAKWCDERAVSRRFDREASTLDARLIAPLPMHARVLPVLRFHDWDAYRRLYLHFWDYAVLERDAFVPNLFAVPGQQVLRYRRDQGPTNSFHVRLAARDLAGFDYVWLSTNEGESPLADVRARLTPVAHVGFDRLFRIGP